MGISAQVTGPDFSQGVSIDLIKSGENLLGHVGDKAVMLVNLEGEFYAVGAHCSHYGGPLNEGLIEGETVHCPWHHGVFNLKTGEALKAPPLNPISCWHTEVRDGKVFITGKKKRTIDVKQATASQSVIIIGGGAAGTASAVMLRRQGFAGRIQIISEDEAYPYDRTNLSKDYLAGKAPDEWLPLWNKDFYDRHAIEIFLASKVMKLDPQMKTIFLADGRSFQFDFCLLATGGTPVKPPIMGIDQSHVCLLRSLKDCHRILERVRTAQKVVIIGAGFIGLEVAASLRERNLEVHVVAPEELPLMKVVGVHVASFLKKYHEQHGVHFHLGHQVKEIRLKHVILEDKTSIPCDFVVVGAGIRPNTLLAEQAGIKVDKGVLVNEFLETSAPGVFAAGDIARWPDPHSKNHIRVEHWEVAERQGQIAAFNILGRNVKFQEIPFFWTQHFDLNIGYIGNSEIFDRMDVLGDMEKQDFAVVYYDDNRVAALLTVGRDQESLMVEEALNHFDNEKARNVIADFERRLHSKPSPPPNFWEPSP